MSKNLKEKYDINTVMKFANNKLAGKRFDRKELIKKKIAANNAKKASMNTNEETDTLFQLILNNNLNEANDLFRYIVSDIVNEMIDEIKPYVVAEMLGETVDIKIDTDSKPKVKNDDENDDESDEEKNNKKDDEDNDEDEDNEPVNNA